MDKEQFYLEHCELVDDDGWDYLECDVCNKQLKKSYLPCGTESVGFGCICMKCFMKGK